MSPLFRHLLLLTALSCPGLLPAQPGPTPPARLQIPANLAAAGTTTTVNGAAWGYVVWTPSDPAWLTTREILVTLKPAAANAAGTYTPVGTVGLVTDPKVIKVLANRAAAIGEDIPKCLENSEKLIREWSTVTPAVVPAALEDRMAILTRRAQQSEFHAASLRQHGHSHPLFRMVMGLAWAGPLGVPNGQDATIELRSRIRSNGADGGIAGRVTLRAGVNDAAGLPVAGTPVQVSPGFLTTLPATPETTITIPRTDQAADLGVHLRWAVPEALRRQVLLTRGFHVWRVKQGYTPPLGLNGAGLESAAAAPAPPLTNPPTYANVVRLTRNPAVARKLYRVPGSGESGPDVNDFTTDPDTHFLTDDNKRYQTSPSNPKLITGTPYRENDRFDYVIAPVDLLGRLGPVSGRGEGIACRTVPPTVPDVVRVDNVIVSGNPRLRLVWKANPTPAANTAVVPTTHYLIFRDRAKNTAPAVDSLQRIEDPAQQSSLVYIGTVVQPASPGPGGTLTFDDPMLPLTDDYGRTYFYTVRSVHQGPLGYLPSSPSPPIFGTFRDRTGPPAPSGNLVVQTPRVGVQAVGITGSTATTAAIVPGSTHLRLAGTRQESTVQWIEFRIPTIVNGEGSLNVLPRLYFGSGNSVWTDILWPLGRGIIEARAGLASGRFSHWEAYNISTALDESERHTLTFTARVRTTRQLIPDDDTGADYWEKFLPSPTAITVTHGLENTKTASIALSLTPGMRDYVIQAQRFGSWATVAAASALSNAGTLVFQDTFPTAAQAYRIWRVTDPPGTPTQFPVSHEPRPENSIAVIPVNYWMNIPAGAREYRIYRRINDGALTLLKQDAGTYDATITQSVMSEDLALPPYGGSLSYYGQVFDDHGNPSALALLGTVPFVEPQLPQPVLDTLEPQGTAAAPVMRVRAACPSPGVEYLKLTILPEPETPAGLVKVTPAPGSWQFEAGTAQDYPAALQSNAITAAADQPAVIDISFPIKAGVEYTVSATAISPGGKEGAPSDFQKLTWTAPLVAGEVAWPARPLPPVIDWNPELRAFETTELMFRPGLTLSFPRNYLTYPVGIRLGSINLSSALPDRDTTGFESSNWDIFPAGPLLDIRYGNFAWDDGSTGTTTNPYTIEQKLMMRYFPQGDIGFYKNDPPLLPVVLYRQQIGWGTVSNMTPLPNTDVVQVSPLINRIETSVVVSGGRNFRVMTDPFVNAVMIHSPSTSYNATRADLCLFDTTPVTYLAVYQYYLAHFDKRGEIDAILDAGKVSITQP